MTDIEGFLTIYGHSDNLLNNKYFAVMLFAMLYKMVPSFESVDEILKGDNSNESYWTVRSCSTFYLVTLSGKCGSRGTDLHSDTKGRHWH